MRTDMSPDGLTELTPKKGDRNFGKVVLTGCGSSWRNGGAAAAVAIYARVWFLAHKPHDSIENIRGANAILNAV